MISHHHSSIMPEGILDLQESVSRQSITKEEVRALFDVWNNALATLDPQQVAALYSVNGNLLPTLSDKQRLNRDEIADYFVKFLSLCEFGLNDGTNFFFHIACFQAQAFSSSNQILGRIIGNFFSIYVFISSTVMGL